ncbi:MAG: flavodoxin domain-containing protein [Bacteroidales bacterium]|jgi:menaquinone-dependent protoporphyrinogen IX oxidase
MKNTLIVFGTRRGTTERTAQVIGEMLVLRFSHHVQMINVKKIRRYRKILHTFDNIIVGSSIVRGRWVWRAKWFLRRYDFRDQKLAVFVTAGYTLNKSVELDIPKEEVVKEAIASYIDRLLEPISLKPVSKMAFGGMIVKSKRKKFNSWNREDIEAWVMELGKILK